MRNCRAKPCNILLKPTEQDNYRKFTRKEKGKRNKITSNCQSMMTKLASDYLSLYAYAE
jgi:hypothetical protein